MTKYLKLLLVPTKDGEMQGTHTYCTTSPGMAHHCSIKSTAVAGNE